MSSRNDNPDQETPAAAQANPLCEQPRPAALEKAEDQCSVCASIPSIPGMLVVVLGFFPRFLLFLHLSNSSCRMDWEMCTLVALVALVAGSALNYSQMPDVPQTKDAMRRREANLLDLFKERARVSRLQ